MLSESLAGRQPVFRSTGFEPLETRTVFSVNPLAGLETPEHEPSSLGPSSLAAAHAQTGASYVMNDYGFDGSGQTVVVIDSGIAWDHYALGGGYGAGYRVVGGWDFAEGDANPYDDGPAGFHGTHVAGIIGSSDSTHRGVASGVDLVALRVFDDRSNSRLEWLEQALQWVHDHRNDFVNPITTVNLSLGMEWNDSNVPGWATLETHLARLKSEGIFISVAAGNAFRTFNEPGLSYPAVSSHVIPVASHNSAGVLSDFSQRHDRVIVAPGESIRSTVPDHLFGGTKTGQFLGSSGTSMAAPYVAGASAVVREAMEFMGRTGINQDSIYQVLRSSADRFMDQASGDFYHRLNLGKAIDAIVDDLHGNVENPFALGTLSGKLDVSGTIGKLSDVDGFRFQAAHTGKLYLDVTQTHELSAIVRVNGQSLQFNGSRAVFEVAAGENYVVSVSTGDGRGHYQIGMELKKDTGGVTLSDRVLTVTGTNGSDHVGITHSADGRYIQVAFNGVTRSFERSSVDSIRLSGGEGNDHLYIRTGSATTQTTIAAGQLTSQSGSLMVDAKGFESVHAVGKQADTVVLRDTAGSEDFHLGNGSATLTGNALTHIATGFGSVIARSSGGADQATLTGGSGDDQFDVAASSVRMQGSGLSLETTGFANTRILAGAGNDRITITSTTADDRIDAGPAAVSARLGSIRVSAIGVETIIANATDSRANIRINGTDGDDYVWSSPRITTLTNGQMEIRASGFGNVLVDASAGGGHDIVQIADSDGHDSVTANHFQTRIVSSGLDRQFLGFHGVTITGTGNGTDSIQFTGTRGRDVMEVRDGAVRIRGARYEFSANGFDSLTANGNGGNDLGFMQATRSGNTMSWREGEATMVSRGFRVTARDFERVRMQGSGSGDSLYLSGLGSGDRLTASGAGVLAWLDQQSLEASGFSWMEATARSQETATSEISAVDFWYALHGNWQGESGS
jgi:subtilisin family serine protease